MKYYNNFFKISSDLQKIFNKVFSFKYKHLKYLSFSVVSFILSGSVVTSKFAPFFELHNPYFIQPESVERKIRRFFSSFSNFAYAFYSSLISHIINSFVVSNDNPVHITLDHMYCKKKFTILLFSLRIGKQGIPLWFRCFKGYQPPQAMSLSLFNEGISFCANLFKPKNSHIVFLADRFFSFVKVLNHIESLGCFYVFRTKSNFSYYYYNKKGFLRDAHIHDIKPRTHSSKYLPILFTAHQFPTTLVVVRAKNTSDPWYLLTNDTPNRAAHHYSKRFGSIECIFKNQKSNRVLLRKN